MAIAFKRTLKQKEGIMTETSEWGRFQIGDDRIKGSSEDLDVASALPLL